MTWQGWLCEGHTRAKTSSRPRPCPECCGYAKADDEGGAS